MTTSSIVILIIAVVAAAIGIWMLVEVRRASRLRRKFGPEYDHVVSETGGNPRTAQAILDDRQKRVSKLNIQPLTQDECAAFVDEWRRIQNRFVDEPRVAVWQADALVNRALQSRGYPMAGFEQQAADISVEHPEIVQSYRAAHDIAVRDQRGRTTTEELRRAMQLYRDLSEHVLDLRVARV